MVLDDDNYTPIAQDGAAQDALMDNPKKGYFYYIFHTVLLSANLYAQQ